MMSEADDSWMKNLEEERQWLRVERKSMAELNKRVQREKRGVEKTRNKFESLQKEIKKLDDSLEKEKDNIKELRRNIGLKRKSVKHLRKLSPNGTEGKLRLEEKKQNVLMKLRQSREKYEDLQRNLKLSLAQFDETGKHLAFDVNRRVKITNELETKTKLLKDLTLEHQETGILDLDMDDPLFLIESPFPFFQDGENCDLKDIGNIQNPRKCIETMEWFVNVIHDNIHRFKYLPLGPLFKQVRVTEKKWSALVEYVLQPYVFSFLVDNIVDSLVMKELLEEHFPGYDPGTTTRDGVVVPKYHINKFNESYLMDARITATTNGFDMANMVDTILCDNENWEKFLSRTISIEKIIFMDDENVAFLVLSQLTQPPYRCNVAYTLDGFKVYPFPTFKTEQIRFMKRSVYLKCTPDSRIPEIKQKIGYMKSDIERLNMCITTRRSHQFKMAETIDAWRARIKSSKYEISDIENTLDLFNRPATYTSEKRELKLFKSSLKRLYKNLERDEFQRKTKSMLLPDLQTKHATRVAHYNELLRELNDREEVFYARRDALWDKEEKEENALELARELASINKCVSLLY